LRSKARPILVVVAILTAALGAVPSAEAAKRKAPFGFFASVLPPVMTSSGTVSNGVLERQMALMARSGVESVRLSRAWADVEPAPGSYQLAEIDRVVAAAARHRLQVIVNVTRTPRWAAANPSDPDYWRLPPADYGAFGRMMAQLVRRYGPAGTLWAQNPSLPRVPVRQWQIWNEPTGPAHWKLRPWAPTYTQLLKSAYESIHAVDGGAKVASGALVATADANGVYSQWAGARDLYKAGAKRYMDVVSIHPFTNNSVSARKTAQQTLEIVRRVRAVMKKNGDRRKPVVLTEMTWPASKGKVPKSAERYFSVSRKGQAARLKAAYAALVKARRKLRITNAYWYTWATPYDRSGSISVMAFNFSGLTRFQGGAFKPLPILKTYARTAAKYQGCKKSANARRCR
jgi:Cellulase (glycosyl hydrolase family 5)